MKSDPRVPGDITLMDIGYKRISHKLMGFISTGGRVMSKACPYLYCYPKNSNVYILPGVPPHIIGRYFSYCNQIDNHNSMRKYDLAMYKYWVL